MGVHPLPGAGDGRRPRRRDAEAALTDFSDTQRQLTQARVAREQAFEGYVQARAKLRELEDEAARAARSVADGDGDLEEQLKQARADAQRAKSDLERTAAAEHGVFGEFVKFSDPREGVGELPDGLPILLFPVRLEARFKTIEGEDGGAARHELWVRIFADTCMIDTFEPDLSDAEVRSARAYWQEIWRAAGDDDGRRAAWRNLVASHGSGRAEWIVDNYRPLNPDGEPTKDAPEDVLLVIAAEAAPSAGDAAALSAYWPASWKADGDAAAQQAARDTFDTAVGAQRSKGLLAEYRPFNLNDQPVPPLDRSQTDVSVAFVLFPVQPATASSWTRAPKVDLLPERFVLLATAGSSTPPFNLIS